MKFSYILAVMALATAGSATAQRAPLMGWSSWNTYGLEISEQLIKEQADAMISTGLKDAGYQFINIDDGFWNGRAADGTLNIDTRKFPNGMRAVSDYIHSVGLKAGIYSDAGDNTCGSQNREPYGLNVGLFRHEEDDCKTYFIDWNYDFIKVDYCGGINRNLDDKMQYTKIANAIKNCGRDDIQFNICRWAYPGTWVEGLADSWRTTEDIYDSWNSVQGIINQNLYLSAYCRNGHYNDMDMLEVGRSMTKEEDRTHFAMWCILSSPLLVGCDMRNMKDETIELLTNTELIALNQDPLHLQAYVAYKSSDCYILVKDIEERFGTIRAIAVYNPSTMSRTVNIDLTKLELGGNVELRDLMNREDLGTTDTGKYRVSVAPHGTVVLKAVAEKRLERERYEGECGYISDYQEIANNEVMRTGIYSGDTSCSGGMKAGWLGYKEDNDLRFDDVYSAEGGEYEMTIAFLSGEDREVFVDINGKNVAMFTANSGGYNTVRTTKITVDLKKGVNTVRFSNPEYFMPDIDYFDLKYVKPSGIEAVSEDTRRDKGEIYNLNGVRMQNTPDLPSGIYIIDGKKVAK
ncbi:MAG: alpha-galactosidase [Bacteroidales bacterium]|nr:alpha-galactosidase [Bacteroidales bacterium]